MKRSFIVPVILGWLVGAAAAGVWTCLLGAVCTGFDRQCLADASAALVAALFGILMAMLPGVLVGAIVLCGPRALRGPWDCLKVGAGGAVIFGILWGALCAWGFAYPLTAWTSGLWFFGSGAFVAASVFWFVATRLEKVGAASNDWREKLDWHDSPLVGRYVRTPAGTWWADAILKNLGYAVRLGAFGDEPSSPQMEKFEALAQSLPTLIAASGLEPIPEDDGWGHAPPFFDVCTTRVSSLRMKNDGGYSVILEVAPEGEYMLAPVLEISPDHKVVSAEWNL